VPQLPFELAAFPALFRLLRLPVVSYALPALIALGQARHTTARAATCSPGRAQSGPRRTLESLHTLHRAVAAILRRPLTSFVILSLVASACRPFSSRSRVRLPEVLGSRRRLLAHRYEPCHLGDHALRKCLSHVPVTFPADELRAIVRGCRSAVPDGHRYTGAAGGWAWTISGGVPDADDTAGTLLALRRLAPRMSECGNSA